VRRKREAEPIGEPSSVPKRRLLIVLGALALGPVMSLAIGMEPKVRELQPQIEQSGVRGLPPAMPMPLVIPDESFSELVRLAPAVIVQINQYQRTEASAKLVPYFGRLYDAEAWLRDDRGTLTIGSLEADVSVFQRKNSVSYVSQLQWFEVGEYQTASRTGAKLLQLPAIALGQNRFVIVTLQSPCAGPNCDAAIETLGQAAEQLVGVRNPGVAR